MTAAEFKEYKAKWLEVNQSVLPYCFDVKELNICKNCGFVLCKFHPDNEQLEEDISCGRKKY